MRPRLTKKVIRGLREIVTGFRSGGSAPSPLSDIGAALGWSDSIYVWSQSPRRKGQVPKQFRKRRRRS